MLASDVRLGKLVIKNGRSALHHDLITWSFEACTKCALIEQKSGSKLFSP